MPISCSRQYFLHYQYIDSVDLFLSLLQPGEPLIVSSDEPPRPQTTMEALAKLRPAFANGLPHSQEATVTAGNASALADGAAALLLCRADTAKSLGV